MREVHVQDLQQLICNVSFGPLEGLSIAQHAFWCAGDPGNSMPAWMQSLHSMLESSSTPQYLRLFLTKMIIHVDMRHADRAASQPMVSLVRSLLGSA